MGILGYLVGWFRRQQEAEVTVAVFVDFCLVKSSSGGALFVFL